ncbi:MAG: hypothetical protein ACFFBV_07895 [Promethearchaeota archaeon]
MIGQPNQSAWDLHTDGNICLRFYVRNSFGNNSFTEVRIEKDTSAPVITIQSPHFLGLC